MVVKGILTNTGQGESRFEGKQKLMSESQIANLLGSGLVASIEKVNAMRQILSRAFDKEDMSKMFADVLRGSATCTDEHFKRMTHLYFSLYCDSNQELALMCVHLLRKDCADRSPITRSSALRLLCTPKLAELSHLLPDSIHRCSMDSSGLVRRGAAAACVYSHFGFKEPVLTVDDLIPHLSRLLESPELPVISATLQALYALRPENFTGLVHDKFRRLVGLLSGLDDAGKIAACEILGLYARQNFAGPESPSADFNSLVEAIELEISSASSASVLAVALKTRMAIGGRPPTEAIARAISIWGYSEEVTASFLRALIPYAADLKPIFRSFLIFSSESAEVKREKLKILAGLLDEDNCSEILRELQTYLRTQSANPQVTGLAVGLATRIAEKFPRHLLPVMRGFFALLDASDENLSSEVVVAVRKLFSRARATEAMGKNSVCAALATFASVFTRLGEAARCSVLWMLTEFHDEFPAIYPDFLRKLDCSEIFGPKGSAVVQAQTLLIASKVWHYHATSGKEASQKLLPRLEILIDYILRLGIFRASEIFVRDLALTLTTMFGSSLSGGKIGEKVFGAIRVDSETRSDFVENTGTDFPANSLSFGIKRALPGLIIWPEFSGEKNENLREVSAKTKRVTSTSSAESTATRVSSSVALPANLKAPVPKAPTSLAELDLFFSAAPLAAPVLAEKPAPPVVAEKPAMDLAAAADLFRN